MTELNALFYHEIMLVYNYDNTGSQFCIILWKLKRKRQCNNVWVLSKTVKWYEIFTTKASQKLYALLTHNQIKIYIHFHCSTMIITFN